MPKKEVVDYIRQNISKGYSISDIKKQLKDDGWAKGVIDAAIAEVEGSQENSSVNIFKHYFRSILDFFRKDKVDSMFFLISVVFLIYLFLNDTLFLLGFLLVTGVIVLVHHKHHDIIQSIIAYYNGFSISALLLFTFVAIYTTIFSSVRMKFTTIAFIYIIPLTLLYTLTSSILVLYFHERLIKEINYKGVFLFIFITNVMLIASVMMGMF